MTTTPTDYKKLAEDGLDDMACNICDCSSHEHANLDHEYEMTNGEKLARAVLDLVDQVEAKIVVVKGDVAKDYGALAIENQRLRTALEGMYCRCTQRGPGWGNYAADPHSHDADCVYRIAREALERK